MNMVLRDVLRSSASELRAILDEGGSTKEAREHKERRMADIWTILNIHLGTLFPLTTQDLILRGENASGKDLSAPRGGLCSTP